MRILTGTTGLCKHVCVRERERSPDLIAQRLGEELQQQEGIPAVRAVVKEAEDQHLHEGGGASLRHQENELSQVERLSLEQQSTPESRLTRLIRVLPQDQEGFQSRGGGGRPPVGTCVSCSHLQQVEEVLIGLQSLSPLFAQSLQSFTSLHVQHA